MSKTRAELVKELEEAEELWEQFAAYWDAEGGGEIYEEYLAAYWEAKEALKRFDKEHGDE